MKHFSVLVVVAAMLWAAAPVLAQVDNAVYDLSAYGRDTPVLVVNKSGTGLFLIDRDSAASFGGTDYAFVALARAVERNPGLLGVFFENVFLPAVPSSDGAVVISNEEELRWLNDRLLVAYHASGLGRYVTAGILPLVREDPEIDAAVLPEFSSAWYTADGDEARWTITLRKAACDRCPGSDKAGICPSGYCFKDCVLSGNACMEFVGAQPLFARVTGGAP